MCDILPSDLAPCISPLFLKFKQCVDLVVRPMAFFRLHIQRVSIPVRMQCQCNHICNLVPKNHLLPLFYLLRIPCRKSAGNPSPIDAARCCTFPIVFLNQCQKASIFLYANTEKKTLYVTLGNVVVNESCMSLKGRFVEVCNETSTSPTHPCWMKTICTWISKHAYLIGPLFRLFSSFLPHR